MKHIALILSLTVALSGCAGAWGRTKAIFAPNPQQTRLQSLTTGGQSAAALDGASAAQLAAAVAAPNAARPLGQIAVALGSPAQQGFWLKSPLTTAPAKGRVALANGQAVTVDLWPGTGGATLSLSAYRALGLSLTDLPQVQVFALP
jgi:hypothetical protein